MKFIIPLLFMLWSGPLLAQVSVISVSQQDRYTKMEDFWHTFEYYIITPSGKFAKCQATRIGKRWFLTAAHCLKDMCKGNCLIRFDMMGQEASAFGEIWHISKPGPNQRRNEIAFVHPKYDPTVITKNDVALLKFDFDKARFSYYKRGDAGNMAISQAQFNRYLQTNANARAEYQRVLNPENIPIVTFDKGNYRLDRDISVVSIFSGVRSIKKDPNPAYYLDKLGFAYTRNFGMREGISGSGVMVNTGELIGIVSSNVVISTYNNQNNKKIKRDDYFMFTTLDPEVKEFMIDTMGSDYSRLDMREAYPDYVKKDYGKHEDILFAVNDANKKNAAKAARSKK